MSSDFQKTILFQHLFYQVPLNDLVLKRMDTIDSKYGTPVYTYPNSKRPVKKGMIPKDTKTLIFDMDFNKDIQNGSIPESVKTIMFEGGYYAEHASECDGFNQSIDDETFPKKLEVLKFMGGKFNQFLYEGIFPNTLRELELSNFFKLPITKGVLPESLVKLRINSDYEHSLKGILPKSLKVLILKGNFRNKQFESGEIPEGIEKLTISMHRANHQPIPDDLIPKSVKVLHLDNVNRLYWKDGFFPEGLEMLNLRDWAREEDGVFEFKGDILPSTLKDLYMKVIGAVNFEENCIPDGLKKFHLYCHSEIRGYQRILPNSVEVLEMEIMGIIVKEEFRYPTSLRELSITGFYKNLNHLPNTIEKLILKNTSYGMEKGYIPESVRYLKMIFVPGWEMDMTPSSLEYLETDGMNYAIHRDRIPKTLNLILKKGGENTNVYIGRFGFIKNRNEFFEAYERIIENEMEGFIQKSFSDELLEKMRNPDNLVKWMEKGYSMDEALGLMGFSV
jgi:hypothetical protein